MPLQSGPRNCGRSSAREAGNMASNSRITAAAALRQPEQGAAANGARREAERERRTVRVHLLRGNKNAGIMHTIPGNHGNRGQGSRDLAAAAAVRAAVFGCATLAHQRRRERPFRHRICDQDAPSLRLGRSSSARSARASWAAWGRRADRSRAGRAGPGGP